MDRKKPQIKSIEMQFSNAQLLPEVIKLIEEEHSVTLQLRGFSMRPFLEDKRDRALLTKVTQIKVGDPVLAEVSPKHYVLHRIIKIEGTNVTLRGDGNLGTEHCKMKDIKASVIGFYRKGRKNLDSTEGTKWKLYTKIWTCLSPFRKYLLTAYRRIWIPIFGHL